MVLCQLYLITTFVEHIVLMLECHTLRQENPGLNHVQSCLTLGKFVHCIAPVHSAVGRSKDYWAIMSCRYLCMYSLCALIAAWLNVSQIMMCD